MLKIAKYILINLLVVCSVNKSFAESEPKNLELYAGYINQDLCWTTNVEDCRVIGLGVGFRYPVEWFFLDYVVGNASIYESEDKGSSNGPVTQSDLFKLGLGSIFEINNEISFYAEALFVIANDDETFYDFDNTNYNDDFDNTNYNDDFDNTNYNDGFEIVGGGKYTINNKVKVGTAMAFQRYQNCSAVRCHGLKGDKPDIENLEAQVNLEYKFTEKLHGGYRMFKVVKIFNDDDYNGRSKNLSHLIFLRYLYEI